MTDLLLTLGGGVLAGAGLSAASHAALWWTLRRLPTRRRPLPWLAVSAGVRIVVVAAGLAVLAWASVWALVGGAIGFLATRTAAIARVDPNRPPVQDGPLGRDGRTLRRSDGGGP